MTTPSDKLLAIFDADRALRGAEDKLMNSVDEKELATTLVAAVAEAHALSDRDEQELRLSRLADLCAQVQSRETVRALISILDHDEESVIADAGHALLDVAFDRFKEVALAIEDLLAAGHEGHAMEELPYILTEVRDPDPVPLVARFLAHPKAEVVAAGIEALAAFGDPSAIRHLEKLVNDPRQVAMPDTEDETVSLGDLAADALAELEGDPGGEG